MAEVVRDADVPDDLVLEVCRVEDARTVTQRLQIQAQDWRTFMELPASASPQEAYEARQDFWDWLAEEYAETEPGTPSAGVEGATRTPDLEWLREKHAKWPRER